MRAISNTIILILTIIGTCLILSIIPNYIQGNKINKNLIKSIDTIIEDDTKPSVGNIMFFKLDNFTDALMMNIAYNVNSDAPVKSSMENKYYIGKDDDIIFTTKNILHNNYTNALPVNYTRYWHGNQLFLRPLLVLMDYNGIRTINCICLSGIFLCLCILLLRKCDRMTLSVICVSVIAFNLWLVPLSMQFSTTFYISFAASAILLACMKKGEKEYKHIHRFFIVTGGATSFFDLLTTPLITLGLPLTIYTSMSEKSIRRKYQQVCSCSAAWLLGYSAIWISKWCIAHLIIGYDINDAVSSILFRTSTEYNNFDMSLYGIFGFLANHAPIALAFAILSVTAFLIFNITLYNKKKKSFIENSHLLLIATMPFIWCIVLRNHSIIHCSFVWRVFFISMVSYLLFIVKIYSARKIIKENKQHNIPN